MVIDFILIYYKCVFLFSLYSIFMLYIYFIYVIWFCLNIFLFVVIVMNMFCLIIKIKKKINYFYY